MDGNRHIESLDHGLPEGLPEEIAPTILAAVASGRKIEAIKLLRGATGLGLREARTIVDQLEADFGASDQPVPQAPGFSEEAARKASSS